MSATSEKLRRIYDLARKRLGPQHWWPAETPFEVMIGAILTQNTAWTNVEKAIANLKRVGWLSPEALRRVDPADLARAIRPAGTFNVKARRLKTFVDWFERRFGSSVDRMSSEPLESLREELLQVSGIGRETADSILLYAVGKPTFVVDAYTARLLRRHGLIDGEADYDEIQSLFESALPSEARVYNEYHALLVALGKEWCTKRNPDCSGCPLKSLLPICLEEAGNGLLA